MRNWNKLRYFIDSLIILLNIAGARGNYLPYFLFNMDRGIWVDAVIIIIDLIYLAFRMGDLLRRKRQPYTTPVLIAIILVAYNTLNVFISGGNYIPYFEFLIILTLFSMILSVICSGFRGTPIPLYDQVKQVSRGYIWISMFSILGVVVSFILLEMGFTSYEPVSADFLESNIESGATYCRSFFSINSIDTILRVPFFQDFGILSGLFHEPHIFAYNAFPCLFLLMGLYNKGISKIIWIVLSVLVVLFSGSTTNILSLAICLLVFYFLRVRSNFVLTTFGVILMVAVVYLYIGYDDTLYEFVLGRLETDNNSQTYSRSLLEFAFTPKSFFGTDFLTTSYITSSSQAQDVGFIPFFMNIVFMILYLRNVYLLFKKEDNLCFFIAMSSLYFIIHSLKIGMTMYIHTPYIFLVYLQSLALSYYGRISAAK